MGFLRKGTIYRAPVRWYPGGPVGMIEFYEAKPDAEVLPFRNTFFPVGLFWEKTYPDGVGELTHLTRRRFYYTTPEDRPPGKTHVGTASDFLGTTPYPGPAWEEELPVCPTGETFEVPPWECDPISCALGLPSFDTGDAEAKLFMVRLNGFVEAPGTFDLSSFEGAWVQLCNQYWDTYAGHYPGPFTEPMVAVSLFFSVHNRVILSISFQESLFGEAFGLTYIAEPIPAFTGPITLHFLEGDTDKFSSYPASITVLGMDECSGEGAIVEVGGGGGTEGIPSITPRTFKSSVWFPRPWFTPRWA